MSGIKAGEREKLCIAPYAMHSCETRGRAHPEKEDPWRSVYQRDRDRIIHSTAFRRLEYKTQVFVNHEGDHYRTRLTHTLEVSQLARSLARALSLNEELTESISLAHDLGHTPFGHSGERALHELMEGHGGFEHNRHGLRVVDILEERYPDFPGLNLSYEVREGIAKHKTPYDNPDFSEFEPDLMATLEAQVAAVCDEVAYNNHDVDDGLAAGLLKEDELDEVEIFSGVRAGLLSEYPGIKADVLRRQIVRNLINLQVTDLIAQSSINIRKSNPASSGDVRKAGRVLIHFSPEMHRKITELREFLSRHLYNHYRVKRMSNKAERFIRKLFNAYLHDPSQLPPAPSSRLDEKEPHRTICDYMAGMTDRYALDEYKRFFEPYERV